MSYGTEKYSLNLMDYMGFPCLHCGKENKARVEDIAKGKKPYCGKCKQPLCDDMDMPFMKEKALELLQDAFVEPEDLDDLDDILEQEGADDWV